MDDDFGKDNSQDKIALELAKHEEAMEEAAAEEAFISGEEDAFENPLVPEVKEEKESDAEEAKGDEILDGAFGSGGLNPVGTPFNNEEAFKDESTLEAEENTEAEAKPDEEEKVEPVAEAEPEVEKAVPVEEVKEMSDNPAVEKSTPAPEAEPKSAPEAETPLFETKSAAPATGEAPKKKKKGLVILIVVLLLLIAGGLAAFFIIRAHEAPERQISDAIEKLYTADATQFSGTVTLKPKVSGGTDSDAAALAAMVNIKLSIDGATKGANASGSGKLSIGVMGMSMEASVSGAYIANDGIYFKLDGLGSLAETLNLSSMISNMINLDESSMSETEKKMAEEVAKILISSVLEKLDGDWYKIDSSSFEAGSKELKAYNCLNEAMGKISGEDAKKQIAEAYKKNPMIVYDGKEESEDGLTFFSVKADEKASKEFAKEVQDIEAMKSLKTCLDSSSNSKEESNTDSDVKIEKDDKTTTEIKLGITGWTHELKAVKGNMTSDSMAAEIDIKINYEDKAVNAPEGSKNISGLMDSVKKDVAEKVKTSSIWDDLIYEQCADAYRMSNGRMTTAQCQQAFKEQLDKNFFESEEYQKMIDGIFDSFGSKSASGNVPINM